MGVLDDIINSFHIIDGIDTSVDGIPFDKCSKRYSIDKQRREDERKIREIRMKYYHSLARLEKPLVWNNDFDRLRDVTEKHT